MCIAHNILCMAPVLVSELPFRWFGFDSNGISRIAFFFPRPHAVMSLQITLTWKVLSGSRRSFAIKIFP